MPQKFDVVVIGAGIIGLAAAYKLLQKKSGLQVAVLEKESQIASHQTGRNSGVIHQGIYYKPGSLKAENCVRGAEELIRFCDTQGVLYRKCGKVIVAKSEDELPRLQELYDRGRANGVPGLKLIGPVELKEIEPHTVGLQALHSPHTAVVNFSSVAHALAKEIERKGGAIFLRSKVKQIDRAFGGFDITTNQETISAEKVINCGGLWADRIAGKAGVDNIDRIVPFRGEYYELTPHRRYLVRGLVYPVASPELPFLGVHLSKTLDGSVEAGPNAALALSRSGYSRMSVNLKDAWDALSYPGLWRCCRKNFRTGAKETFRSFSKRLFFKDLKRFIPELELKDLVYKGSGVRAQLVTKSGALADDFVIEKGEGIVHVLNAPSPAASASLSIGTYLTENL
jgi:(S)-2-hydroxyglutarate dehydrogenase